MRPIGLVVLPAAALCALAASGAACSALVKASAPTSVQRTTPMTASSATARAATSAPSAASGLDLHSASAVALAEVEATWTLNTVIDTSWYGGELAATVYMTPRYAASIRKNRPVGSPGATWIAWAAHRVTTSVTASIEADPGGPRDTALTAYRKVIVTVTPRGVVVPADPNDGAPTKESATPIHAAIPDGPATTDQTGTPEGAEEGVGQPEVWVTYLVLSRERRGAPWRVARSETTR